MFDIVSVFEEYGWYILLSVIASFFIWRKLRPFVEKYQKYQSEQEYAAKYHKNPDLLAARLAAQQARAEELQQKYNEQAKEYEKKIKEKEEKKREQLLERLSQIEGVGNRLGNKESKSFKPEYNPLMGSSGTNYRPPKRKVCGGGGCGN